MHAEEILGVTVEELALHGDFGLGTYEDLDGAMVVVDGRKSAPVA